MKGVFVYEGVYDIGNILCGVFHSKHIDEWLTYSADLLPNVKLVNIEKSVICHLLGKLLW